MANSEPHNREDSVELQKNYAEAISRTTKFLISSAIILLILIVVVGQELREYRRKQKTLVNQIESTAQSDRRAVGKFYKQYKCILKDLEDEGKPTLLSATAGVSLREIPITTRSVHKTKDIDVLVRDEQKLGELIKNLKEKLEREKAKTAANKAVAAKVPSVTALAQSQTSDEVAREAEEELDNSVVLRVSQTRDACALPPDLDKDSLEALLYYLTDYQKLYNERIGLVRELLSITKQSEELSGAKKSIPTPFGSFQIAPKLALLGLAFALVLTYFSFYFSVRKIRFLANKYSRVSSETGSPPVRIPAPFWSPDPEPHRDPRAARPIAHLSDVLLSVLLQVVWLFLTAWLVFECVVTWTALKALAFDYKSVWGYLLIASFGSAVFLAAWQFFPMRFKQVGSLKGAERGTRGGLSRRYFLGIGAVGVIGVITLTVFRFLRKQKGIPILRKQLSEFSGTPVKTDWIQNKRTDVVHYVATCNRHLPAYNNRLEAISDKNRVHGGSQARIFAELGALALKQKQGEVAITYYKKAKALSPLSWHLYDELCRIYGKLERYDEIQPLFQECISHAQRERQELPNGRNKVSTEKRLKFLTRTEKEFNSRIERTNRRKKRCEENQAAETKKNEQ